VQFHPRRRRLEVPAMLVDKVSVVVCLMTILILGPGFSNPVHADGLIYDADGNLVADHFSLKLSERQVDQVRSEKNRLNATAFAFVIELNDAQKEIISRIGKKQIDWLEIRTVDMARFFCTCDWVNGAILQGGRYVAVLTSTLQPHGQRP
jgi:hypothetical protein